MKEGYKVTAFWTVQRGARKRIEATTPEEALEIADKMIADGTWDLSENEEFESSDGPTSLEIYNQHGHVIAERLHKEIALDRAAPIMAEMLRRNIKWFDGVMRSERLLATNWRAQARDFIAEAKAVLDGIPQEDDEGV